MSRAHRVFPDRLESAAMCTAGKSPMIAPSILSADFANLAAEAAAVARTVRRVPTGCMWT